MSEATWRVRGEPLLPPTGSGPLDGLRVAVKDLIAVAGYARGAGNPTWLAEQPPEQQDAPAVAALRAAGAAIAGLAQTDELAFALSGENVHYGTPPNPAAPALVTGGSSSGPASAVAAGEAEIGLGTDTAGSIRVPASCCGLYGLRPTHGAVWTSGVIPLAPAYDTVGVLARDPGVLNAAMRVLLPPARQAPAPSRLVLPIQSLAAVPAAVAEAVRSAARRAADTWGMGLVERRVAWGDRLPDLLAAFRAHEAVQAWRAHGAWVDAHPGALAGDVEARFRYGATVEGVTESSARSALDDWRARLQHDVADAWLVLPAAGGPGHVRGATDEVRDAWRTATMRCAAPASAGGLPSISLPVAAPGEPPVGMALLAPAGADLALLDAVSRYASAPSG